MRYQRDHHRSEHHRTDGQRQDADEMAMQVAQGNEPGAVQQQWWQEDHQHQCGVERDGGCARDECQRCASGDERHRRGQVQAMRQIVKGNHRQQHRDYQFKQIHCFHIRSSGSNSKTIAWSRCYV